MNLGIRTLVFAIFLTLIAIRANGRELDREECLSTIKSHGFLSRAQFQCGFPYYSKRMLSEAALCEKTLGPTEEIEALKSGMLMFDKTETEQGHTLLCQRLAKQFEVIFSKDDGADPSHRNSNGSQWSYEEFLKTREYRETLSTTRSCLRGSSSTALAVGMRSRNQIRAFAINNCGLPLRNILQRDAKRSTREIADFLVDLADTEIDRVLDDGSSKR